MQIQKIQGEEQQTFESTQHVLNLELELKTFSDHNIKNLQSYNSKKFECDVLKLSSQFYNLVQKICSFQQFCINYKQSLGPNQKKLLQNTENKMDLQFEQNDRHQQQKKLIILPVKRVQSSQKDVNSLINKLKVLTIKVKTIESSKFQYIYSTYLSKLKETLQSAKINEKLFRSHTINRILQYLNKNYPVTNLQKIFLYPYHITRYPSSSQNFLYFLNFHCQQLLFLNNMPIKSSQCQSQMLYCPITLQNQPNKHVTVSSWYKNRLTQIQPLWRGYILMVQVYHFQTSIEKPIYTSYLSFKPFSMPAFLSRSQEQTKMFSSFFNYQQNNEEQFLRELCQIRQFVYQKLVFNYLMQVLKNQSDTQCSIKVNGSFKISFEVHRNLELKKKIIKNQIFNQDQKYKAQLITEIFKFVKCKDHFCKNKYYIHQKFGIAMQSLLFKIIAQDLEYRTSNPNFPGSMDLYFYQKKNIGRLSVKRFLQIFGKTK